MFAPACLNQQIEQKVYIQLFVLSGGFQYVEIKPIVPELVIFTKTKKWLKLKNIQIRNSI